MSITSPAHFETRRDENGLVSSVAASKDGKADRMVRREYDAHDRVTKVDYGSGETETFAYDRWGRLSEHARGKLRETYSYDHFGRLAEKDEGGTVYAYTYDAYGQRTSRTVTGARGTSTERRAYDAHGRLAAITEFGKTVKFFIGTNRKFHFGVTFLGRGYIYTCGVRRSVW